MAARSGRTGAKLQTEQLFRSLFLHMGEGVALHEVIQDPSGKAVNYRILDVNPNYEAFTGLRPDQVIGKLATEAYGTPEAPYLHELTSVGLGAAPRRFETYFPPHDRHYEISVAPMGDGYFATIFMDVSEHKRQQEALEAKSDELDQFFRLTIDLLCIADLDGRFLRVNAAWTSLGWSIEELEGKRFLDFIHPDDLPATRAALAELAAGKPVNDFTNRYRARDGSYHFIEWRAAPAPGGRIYSAARDVTQRMQSEAALRAAEEHLRRIFELVPAPLVLLRPDGTLLDCNQAFCACTDYTRDDLIGRTTTAIGLAPNDEAGAALLRALASSDEAAGTEITIRRKDGKPRLLWMAARHLDLAGKPTFILAGQDITEKRALEQQMLHAQKLESLGVLAGGIAHDFNNLLTGIVGNADLARRELSPVSPARESLDDIGAAAQRASELCRQLLAYSGKGRFVVQPLDLAELVREMGHLLAVSLDKHASLQYRFGPDLPTIDADPTQIRQVVMNLIVNASEAIASPGGAIVLRTGVIHCDAAYLGTCSCSDGIQPGDFVFLEVSDTGQGMDRATLERIFDPFFTTKFTGRGLGLAAVLGIVRGHRGAIRVYSEPGRGSTFKLLFPPSPGRERHPAEPGPRAPPWQGRGTVLLADDDEAVRKAGRRMLEQLGFAVLLAEDGAAAVKLFGEEKANIRMVILDLTMPRLDGEACFRALRQLCPEVKVLLTSGYNEQEALDAFAGRGLAGFLQKPFTTDEMIAKLRAILESPD